MSALVLSLLTAGFVYLIAGACSGKPEQVTVLASTSIAGSLKSLARSWQDSEPSVNGQCVAIEVQEKDSADVQQALSPDWDTKRNGNAPDVWIPESAAWARMAADREATARLIPDIQPSIARSSAVIAMPKVMAEAVGWPEKKLSWPDLIAMAKDPEGWASDGHPEWGDVRIGMSNPLKSTASLLALLAMIDANGDTDITQEELDAVVLLKNTMDTYEPDDATALMTKMGEADAAGGALAHLSAFPALERDVLMYNSRNPKEPLAAVYPSDGAPEADNPFLVIQNAPWVSAVKQDAATQFRDFVRDKEGREVLLADGFRDSNGNGGPSVSVDNGLSPQITEPPAETVQPAAVTNTLATWTALNRTTNLLFVMDTSDAMGAATTVDGEDTTLLEVAQDAVRIALNMIGSEKSQVGLWQFSGADAGGVPYQSLVPLERLDEGNRASISENIDFMQAGGPSALYDTAAAAYQHVTENYLAEATNMVVVLTAGANNNPNGGLSLEDLTTQLTGTRDPNRPVSLMTIGYGEGADETAMQEISTATKGQYFASKWPGEISKTLLNALFNAQ
ncbi:substrate-binding and VWA domain-containing protein [Phytomonospora sp. NPDC050363]|uniref:substrate-binding and VWA domain-containing protein n=1 Tax=Phytomonospora sp. NPDC050363 TaxID=3155642 RepID=UPI0033CE431C